MPLSSLLLWCCNTSRIFLCVEENTSSGVGWTKAAVCICSSKYAFFKISQEKTCKPATLLNEILTQVFSCEYCEVFKNIYFEEDLRWLVNQPNHSYDTRIYNLNSVPQIARFSIAGRIISSKTRVVGQEGEERQLWKSKIKQYQRFCYLLEFYV